MAAQEIGLQGSNGVKPLAGVEAQAVASRTYTYQRILENYTINNSANLHVFLPYKFETLSQTEKNRLVEAMRHRYYMTPGTDNPNTAVNEAIYPILAMYGADNRSMTTQGTPEGQTANPSTNYLSSIADPINNLYGCWLDDLNGNGQPDSGEYGTNDNGACGTGNGGMSSKGASRWSYGHTSSNGPAAIGHPNYPHDAGGYGDFWSVRWQEAAQVLTHYYTGIHIRDANDANNVVKTPVRRWAPLEIFGLSNPTESRTLCKNSASGFGVEVQNTGVFAWGANVFELSYRPSWSTTNNQSVNAASLLPAVAAGASMSTLVTVEIQPM